MLLPTYKILRHSLLRALGVSSVLSLSLLSPFAAVAQSPVTLANAGFEQGAPEAGVPDGWTLTAGNPADLGIASGGPEGSQFLWIGPDVSIRQDLSHLLVSGETLTLEYRSSRGSNYARKIQLYARDGTDYELMAETTEQIGDSTWPTIQLNYTVAALYDGRSLALQIVGDDSGDADADDWNEFDDFRITTDSIPATAYAWYRADLGVSLDPSGHVSGWATQTATAHDLDRIVGAPLMIELARSSGGTAPVLTFDGSSAIWAASGDWGSNTENRTVLARVRLKDSSDGFLFDGSTRTGLTRAQVRGGSWQAGVQPSGNFTAADPVTTASTVNLWQTHVFQYEESSGGTTVTHWIDGNQVGSHTVSTDTNLSGLIIGANGAATGWLNMEMAELMVFDRLLTTGERAGLETQFLSRWGDLVDQAFTVQGATTVQNETVVPEGGTQGIVALELTSVGNLAGDAVSSLTFNLNGTTDPADIEELRFYSSTDASFTLANSTFLASAPPANGTVSFDAPVTASQQYIWIAGKLSGNSDDGDLLDAEITAYTLTGPSAGSYVPTVTAPTGATLIQSGWFYSTAVRRQGDDGVHTYRIPGLATSNAGTLLAVFDIRNDSSGDLPGNIDVGLMRSTDGGYTWGPMQTIMDFDGSVSGSSGNGVGDPSILVDRTTGRIWVAALHSFGNNGWSGSGSGLTQEETGQFVLNYSDDDGLTWSAPVSITPQIKDPNWRLYFNGPGKGITTRDGTLIFPAQYRRADGVAHSNFIYSTDNGTTWQNSPPAYVNGGEWTSEAQIVELDNGSLLISMRNYVSRKERLWNIYSWDPDTETIADGSWGTAWYQETDPTVMASVERYSSIIDGDPYSAILFANPDSTSREKMSIRVSLDQGQTWAYKRKIDDRPAAYSCMTILPDGDIGIFYETGDGSAYETISFARFPIEWIVGTTDSDADGVTDFEEAALAVSLAGTEPYARYRSDAGLTLDGSDQILTWESQTTISHLLDRVIGTPAVKTASRSGGGVAPVVEMNGSSALWAGSGNIGFLEGDRTIVARVRLNGTADGFLFDGSTASGKTRAQVRGGLWQVGVQDLADAFTAADPVTSTIEDGLWQSHVFEYEESSGSTSVRHWIDGVQVASHSVAVDTSLGGLILGANGGASGFIEADLAEVILYDRLLGEGERAAVLGWLDAEWGDLNLPLTYQSSTVIQNPRTIPKVGIYELAGLEMNSSGMLPGNVLTSLSYNVNGTTNPSDFDEIRLYDSGSSSLFDPQTAELLATQSSPTGSFALNRAITEESQYLWLAVKLRGTSSDGDILDVAITGFTLSGDDAGDYVPNVTSPTGFLTIDVHAMYSQVLRKGGDDGSGNYRIPALVTTNAGSLIAGFDVRWNGNDISSPDLPADIDTTVMRSTDGGITWSPMQIIMDYDENVSGSLGNGVGDPSLLVDRTTGRIWCAALWSEGNNGWNGSGPGLSPDETGQFVLNFSDDDGLTWSAPVSITPQIKDPNWRLYFNGPGKGITTRDGTLIFPAQYRRADGVAHSNFIYSTDNGTTWQNSPPAYVNGSEWTSEAQIVELDNGSLLISMRNYVSRKERLWNIYSWDPETETIADGTWGTAWYQETDPTVMASVERYRSVLDGHLWSGLLFSNPDSTSREKMSIRLSLDEGQTWPYKRKIDDLLAAYSCMTILPDGDIAILYETGELSSISRLVFARFPLTWLVGTDDSDFDGIPDFHEDVLGLNRNDGNDASFDSDQDGQSNRDEYTALTDLNDNASYFALDSMVMNEGTVGLTVETRLGRNYELQVSSTLEPDSWTTVGNKIRGDGGILQFDYPLGEPMDANLFFRVRVSAP